MNAVRRCMDRVLALVSHSLPVARAARTAWGRLGRPPSAADLDVARDDPTRWQECLGRIRAVEQYVQEHEKGRPEESPPILFLIASSHVGHFGLGAGSGLLASWAVRLAGAPVVYHVCKRGLSQCVLGSNRQRVFSAPPCDACVSLRNLVYPKSHTLDFAPGSPNDGLRPQLAELSWEELTAYRHGPLDLGALCLPSLRWIQRRYFLEPDDFTRRMLIEYMVSSSFLADEIKAVLERLRPRALVLFNGTHFPEAVAHRVAALNGVRAVTYETGFGNAAAFFSHGISTEYAIQIPTTFEMGARENEQLDAFLAQRFKGNFNMSGRRIWSGMRGIPDDLQGKIRNHRQVMSIFTNVTWDTSQAYANGAFRDMFDWVDATLSLTSQRPETLFIVRAHPDELRKGAANEPVGGWLEARGHLRRPNVVLVPPDVLISSYELIGLSKLVAVYNSTVGLEAAVMGAYVLAGGRARYRDADVCREPASRILYEAAVQELLDATGPLTPPPNWRENARRYFYFTVHKASLDLSRFLEPVHEPHFTLRSFAGNELTSERSPEMRLIANGILHGSPFYYE